MKRPFHKSVIHRLKVSILAAGCMLALTFWGDWILTTTAESGGQDTGPQVTAPADRDYSRFSHRSAFHGRLPCLVCHRRDDNSSRIGFPGRTNHMPCAGCHQLQFQDSGSPLCTICHTNAETGAMKRFPAQKTFRAKFDHGRHLQVDCSVCHRPARSGAALSIPERSSAHNTCFRCHTSASSSRMASCGLCHQPGRRSWSTTSSRAFRIGFNHTKHTRDAGLQCSACHTVRRGAATGRQVTAPAVAMHTAPQGTRSCGSCHNGETAFGTDDFSNCRKCHQGPTFRF